MKLILFLLVTALSEFFCEENLGNRVHNGGIVLPEKIEIENRVYNGREVSSKQFPYLARITVSGTYTNGEEWALICSGSLISHHYVLTAAHCLIKEGTDTVHIQLGIDNVDQSGISRTCSQCWTPHPEFKYRPDITQNGHWIPDIALIRLQTHVEFTDRIRPIPLPSYIDLKENLVDKKGTVVGWGKTNIFGDPTTLTTVLLAAPAIVVGQEKCKLTFLATSTPYDPINQFCINNLETGACPGDSGGPFIINGKQFGIVSAGTNQTIEKLCKSVDGGSYTNVVKFLSWIQENSDVNIGRNHNTFPTDWD